MRNRTTTVRTVLAALAVATSMLSCISAVQGQMLPGEPPAGAAPRTAAPGPALPGGQAPGAPAPQVGLTPNGDLAEEGLGEPDLHDWDALSKQVIPRFIAANYTLADILEKYRSASCLVDVTVGGAGMRPQRARYHYGWSDNDGDRDLLDSEIELNERGTPNPIGRPLMVAAEHRLQSQLQFHTLAIFKASSVRTRKTANGFTMTVSPKSLGLNLTGATIVLNITADLRVGDMQVRYPAGTTARYRFTHKNFGGRWLTVGCTQSMIMGTFQISTSDQYAYRMVNGVAFPAGMLITRVSSGQGMRVTNYERYAFGEWKTEKREAPAPQTQEPEDRGNQDLGNQDLDNQDLDNQRQANQRQANQRPVRPATTPQGPARPNTTPGASLRDDPDVKALFDQILAKQLAGAPKAEVDALQNQLRATLLRKAGRQPTTAIRPAAEGPEEAPQFGGQD